MIPDDQGGCDRHGQGLAARRVEACWHGLCLAFLLVFPPILQGFVPTGGVTVVNSNPTAISSRWVWAVQVSCMHLKQWIGVAHIRLVLNPILTPMSPDPRFVSCSRPHSTKTFNPTITSNGGGLGSLIGGALGGAAGGLVGGALGG